MVAVRMMLQRAIAERYRETVESRRVTIVNGPRQAGKTTLITALAAGSAVERLDDPATLEAARRDPIGFVSGAGRPLIIDEIQLGGEDLIRAIKLAVDRDRTPGQFVLAGSANFLTIPTISESLAGRAGFIDLWPFSQGELAGRSDGFVDAVLDCDGDLAMLELAPVSQSELFERLCAGGFPEVQRLPRSQRGPWFRDYVRTVIERDVVEISGLRKADELRQLLRLLAARTGEELVMSHVVEDSALERQAVYAHRAWLEAVFLVSVLPAWSRNLTSRVKRRPKLVVADPGLAAWLLGKSPESLSDHTDRSRGQLVETFVVGEIRRQLGWGRHEAAIYHWRDRDGREVDLVVEAADGRVVAIEVKAGSTPRPEWFRGLSLMRDALGDQLVAGIALYPGDRSRRFAERLVALPISALWEL